MIRVLQVFGRMDRGGAETMIMNLYRNIDRTKVQFDFVVHTDEKCAFDEEIKALGGYIYSVPRLNIKNTLNYKKSWKELLRNHSEWRIVHGHIASSASIYLAVAHKQGRYTISHSHSIGTGKYHFIRKLLEFKIIADYYMACSIAAGLFLFGENKVNSDLFKLLPNAISTYDYEYDPLARDKVRKAFNITGEALIGHVGSFTDVKNHRFLLEIFSAIKKKQFNAKLMLVGDGPLRSGIETKAKELGIYEDIIFTGVRSDVNELLQAMDYFVFPSLFEGLPVTLVEAQASGLPITMSDKVPEEAVLTKDLVTIMSLNQSADEWADHILSRLGKERYGHVEEIKAAGYDISDTSKWLEEFYLSKADEMRQ